MFSRCDIAEEVGTAGSGDGTTDGAGDVVIARCDVRDQGSEDVERSAMAQAFFDFHVGCDFVEDHVARAFDHDLDVVGPGAFGQFAQGDEFFNLSGVGSVVGTARTAGIAEAEGDVVFSQMSRRRS